MVAKLRAARGSEAGADREEGWRAEELRGRCGRRWLRWRGSLHPGSRSGGLAADLAASGHVTPSGRLYSADGRPLDASIGGDMIKIISDHGFPKDDGFITDRRRVRSLQERA